MSELINVRYNRATTRWKLLTGTSALALTAYISFTGMASAEEAGHSQVWIELGGQVERLENAQEAFLPAFADLGPPAVHASLTDGQKPPLYSLGEVGKVSFTPKDSNWLLAVSVLYGRSNTTKNSHYETNNARAPQTLHGAPFVPPTKIFGDAEA